MSKGLGGATAESETEADSGVKRGGPLGQYFWLRKSAWA